MNQAKTAFSALLMGVSALSGPAAAQTAPVKVTIFGAADPQTVRFNLNEMGVRPPRFTLQNPEPRPEPRDDDMRLRAQFLQQAERCNRGPAARVEYTLTFDGNKAAAQSLSVCAGRRNLSGNVLQR